MFDTLLHYARRITAPIAPSAPVSLLASLFTFLALLAVGCATTSTSTTEGDTDSSTARAPASELTEAEAMILSSGNVAMVWVNGMGCPLCANNVERQLRLLPGVDRVAVNLGTGLITAHFSGDDPPTREQLERAVTNSGFTMVRAEVSP